MKEGEDKDPICTSEFQGKACGKEPGQECYCKMKVECYIPPGQGTDLKFSIVIGDQESNSWMFSYAPPRVQSIDRGTVNIPVPTYPGGAKDNKVIITGSNFGLPAAIFNTKPTVFGPPGHGWEKDVSTEAPTMKASRLSGGAGTRKGTIDMSCDLTESDCDRFDKPNNCRANVCPTEIMRKRLLESDGTYIRDTMGKDDIKITIGVHDCNIVSHKPEQLLCTDIASKDRANDRCLCTNAAMEDPNGKKIEHNFFFFFFESFFFT